MSFWLVVILRGKRLPGKVLVVILGSRNCAKPCIMIKNRSQDDDCQADSVRDMSAMGRAAWNLKGSS